MTQMLIPATKYSPLVILTPEGEMTIKGRSILEDPVPFYKTIMETIKTNHFRKLSLILKIEYMNTSSTKLVLELLKTVRECYNTSDVIVQWFYEEDDEDMRDLGKDYESLIKMPIDFYEYSDNAA